MCVKILIVPLRFGLCHMDVFVKINHRLRVCWGSILLITASLAGSCPSPHVLCLCTGCLSAKRSVSACTVHACICSLQVDRVQSFIGRNHAVDYFIPRHSYSIRWTFGMILLHTIYRSGQGPCSFIMWEVKLHIWTSSCRDVYTTFLSNRLSYNCRVCKM
jgi:hypothetical protein